MGRGVTAAAAAAARDLRDFVFFDRAATGSASLLASEPDLILDGGPADWPHLEAELARRARPASEIPGGEGFAAGWLAFDGAFRFGFFEKPRVFPPFEERGLTRQSPPPPELDQPIGFSPRCCAEKYAEMVRKAQAYIAAGDIYQVCLAYPYEAEFSGDPFAYYLALREQSPAPHAAYLSLGDTRLASASPELFLAMDGRRIETRPIKGTRPRHPDHAADHAAARELLESPKESAELVMITDLERNDLGRVCEFGSVAVPELLRHERFRQVHHLVSTVTGRLRPDVSHAAALMACSPGGSISGAPKIRALEIIAELEAHPRGIYTGAIGFFGFGGTSRFSIAIRTAIFRGSRASFSVGAGIVADSDPLSEWEETGHKAVGLLAAAEFRR